MSGGNVVPIRPLTVEDELVRKYQQTQDQRVFEELYHRCKRNIYSLCLRMTGSISTAEDLTQETFLQLSRKIDSFRGDSKFTTWLHRMGINVVLMQLRKRGLSMVPIEEVGSDREDFSEPFTYGKRDPRLEGAVDVMVLQKAVSELPAGYRLIFILHDVEGYQHKEIAFMLDCSIGNSKSQLHKARLKLRAALGKYTPRRLSKRG